MREDTILFATEILGKPSESVVFLGEERRQFLL